MISNASSTVHALAPVVKLLHEAFGIRRAIFTTVHSYTSAHRLADVPAEDKRRGRAAAENIIPQESRSPAMLAGLLPELAGRVSGYAMNVPVSNGSVVDLVCWHERPATRDAINEVVRTAAGIGPVGRRAPLRGRAHRLLGRGPLELLRDVRQSRDDDAGRRMSKTLSWFDSGYGYAHRAVELVERCAAIGEELGEDGMNVRVGINGFGRIGRSVLRILADRPDIEVVVINDLFDNDHLAYLLPVRHGHGRLRGRGLDRPGQHDGAADGGST